MICGESKLTTYLHLNKKLKRMLTKQVRELEHQADVLDEMQTIWTGKNPLWFEILDAFASAGIRYTADRQKYVIKVSASNYDQAYGILMDLNTELEAGW